MSMCDYETRGYGIQFDEKCGYNTTVKQIRGVLEFAPAFKAKIENWISELGLEEEEALNSVDVYAEYDDDTCCGIPFILASVMNEFYDSNFMEVASDDNGYVYLYMPQVMPWQCDDFMKTLTEEKFCEILRKFYGMLYSDTAYIDSISIRNFG